MPRPGREGDSGSGGEPAILQAARGGRGGRRLERRTRRGRRCRPRQGSSPPLGSDCLPRHRDRIDPRGDRGDQGSGEAGGAGQHRRVHRGGDTRTHDHGGRARYGRGDRPGRQHLPPQASRGLRGRRASPQGLRGEGILREARIGAARAAQVGEYGVLPGRAGRQAEIGADAPISGGDPGHDGGRSERRPRPPAGRHRHRHGRDGDRGLQGGGRHDPRRRQLLHHRERRRGREVHLRQHAGVHMLPHLVQHWRNMRDTPRDDRGISGAPHGDASPVGEPRHRRSARDGAGFQPPRSRPHAAEAPPVRRAHHDPVAPHEVLPHGIVRRTGDRGRLRGALHVPGSHPRGSGELVQVRGPLDSGGRDRRHVRGSVPGIGPYAPPDPQPHHPRVHGDVQGLVGRERRLVPPDGRTAEQLVADAGRRRSHAPARRCGVQPVPRRARAGGGLRNSPPFGAGLDHGPAVVGAHHSGGRGSQVRG
mmetsp:Transcript_6102/g.17880  ORF Transcript_6102/g.17880 Transcript_6102/m.17880 type:complete len:477 (+) Transcript_6102:2572-4002(+)